MLLFPCSLQTLAWPYFTTRTSCREPTSAWRAPPGAHSSSLPVRLMVRQGTMAVSQLSNPSRETKQLMHQLSRSRSLGRILTHRIAPREHVSHAVSNGNVMFASVAVEELIAGPHCLTGALHHCMAMGRNINYGISISRVASGPHHPFRLEHSAKRFLLFQEQTRVCPPPLSVRIMYHALIVVPRQWQDSTIRHC
jgi:hypothetical protein